MTSLRKWAEKNHIRKKERLVKKLKARFEEGSANAKEEEEETDEYEDAQG